MVSRYRCGLITFIVFAFVIFVSAFNSPLPLGDEAGYIREALQDSSTQKVPTNLYILFYRFLLEISSNDPVTAHYLMRAIVSFLAVLALFLILISLFQKISLPAMVLTLAIWTSSYAVSPLAQFGNINLFAFAFALLSSIPFIRKKTSSRFILFFTTLLWTSQIRDEYYLPLLLLTVYGLWLWIRTRHYRKDNKKPVVRGTLPTLASLILLISSIAYLAALKEKASEHSLSLCFGQHYATYYAKKHPEMIVSAMSEYQDVLKKSFDGRTDFFEILKNHPADVLHYLCINGLKNSVIMIPAILRQRIFIFNPLPERKAEIVQILFLLLLMIPGAIIITSHLRREGDIRTSISNLSKSGLDSHKLTVLLIIASAVVIPLFLLIADTRYYSPTAPLILVPIYLLAKSSLTILSKLAACSVSISLSILFCHPLFFKQETNQQLIRSMRENWAHRIERSTSPPLIAGLFPGDIATFAFGRNFTLECDNHLQAEKLLAKNYDYVVINKYFRISSAWQKSRELLEDFESNPEKYGYSSLGISKDKHQTAVYALDSRY